MSAALPRCLAELADVFTEVLVQAALQCRDEEDFVRLVADRSRSAMPARGTQLPRAGGIR